MNLKYEEDWWLGGFLIGFFVGALLGFTYTRLVPLSPYITPAQLSQPDKELYLLLVAAAYRHDGDLSKAERRLAALAYEDVGQKTSELGLSYIEQEADIRDIQSLAALAFALNEIDPDTDPAQLHAYLPTATSTPAPVATATVAATPTSTPTPLPTPTATRTIPARSTAENTQTETVNPTITPRNTVTPGPNAPFGLAQSVPLCDNSANGTLRVYVRDRFGNGIPGAQIEVNWATGQDKFFTGIKSEANPGYADFQMEFGQIYQVKLLGLPSTVATEINQAAADRCPNLPEAVNPSWQIVFQQGVGP